jgi:antitoxin CptB
MDVPDPDLYAALTGDVPLAPEFASGLFDRIKSFRADRDA